MYIHSTCVRMEEKNKKGAVSYKTRSFDQFPEPKQEERDPDSLPGVALDTVGHC